MYNLQIKIYYKLLRLIRLKKIPDVLRKLGVKIGKGCEIQRNVSFGSEPYLISLGDNVRVTEGCKFITHDGGVWVLRKLYKDNRIINLVQ